MEQPSQTSRVRVPHQLLWVPPGCGSDRQPFHSRNVAGEWQPGLGLRLSLWPMGRVTDSPMRWKQKHRVLLWAQAVRRQRSLPCLPLPLNVDARDVLGALCLRGLSPEWPVSTGPLTPSSWDTTQDRRRESGSVSLRSQLRYRLLKSCPRDPKSNISLVYAHL